MKLALIILLLPLLIIGNDTFDCHPQCKTCSGPNFYECTSCTDPKAFLIDGYCLCPYQNQTMAENGYCQRCHYTCRQCLAPHNSSACVVCDPSATLVNGTCRCPPGQGMTEEGKCEPCHPTCKECVLAHRETHCTSCKDSRAVLVEMPIICILIFPPPPECEHFPNKTGKCQCPAGYVMDQRGNCLPCHPSCLNCSFPYRKNKCTSCRSGARLDSDGNCVCINGETDVMGNCLGSIQCHPTCRSCNASNSSLNCTSCGPNAILKEVYKGAGYGECVCMDSTYFNASTNTCEECPDNCLKCSNSTYCHKCSPDAYWINGECISRTRECVPGYYRVGDICHPCPYLCRTCDSLTTCTSCRDGSALSPENQCIPCSLPCQTCKFIETGELICTECRNGYFLNDSECTKCSTTMPNCASCNNSSSCIQCRPPYVLNNNTGKCECPIEYCQNCQLRYGKCIRCIKGYYWENNGTCSQCHETCKSCNRRGEYGCTECYEHAHLVKNSMGSKCVCDEGYMYDQVKKACIKK